MEILLTVDTEMSPRLQGENVPCRDNLERSVFGRVSNGEWGLFHQIREFDNAGIKAVFFVEALCAYVFGIDVLKRIVEPILSRGHEVQLHVHTEWLPWLKSDPVGCRRGNNIADFSLHDQRILLEFGIDALRRCDVPMPVAFRAGNYGANNDTLRALAALGLAYDSSYNYPYLDHACKIRAPSMLFDVTDLDGVVEVPVGFFSDLPGHFRHAQLCAISFAELSWLMNRYAKQNRQVLTLVSHSFELLSRNRKRGNALLIRRFERLCDFLSSNAQTYETTGFVKLAALPISLGSRNHWPPRGNVIRSATRLLEQAYGTLVYDRP